MAIGGNTLIFYSIVIGLYGNVALIQVDGVIVAHPHSGRKTSAPSSNVYTLTEILNDVDLRADNRVRPGYGERVLDVRTFAYLRNIIGINELESTLTINLLFMQIWDDPRVSFSPGILTNGMGEIREILIDNPDFMARMWSPDTFVVNEVKAHSQTLAGSRSHLTHQVMHLSSTGRILKTTRLTVTVSCPMSFESFPFHEFHCDLELESFGHKSDDIVFTWRNGTRSVNYSKIDKKSLAARSSYTLERVESHSQQSHLDTGGSYSKLIIRLYFSKLWLRHALSFFIPTIVLAIVSVLTMWINTRSNRCAGVVANFIVTGLTILFAGLEYATAPLLAQIPFLTPVDIHMGICLCVMLITMAFHGVRVCVRERQTDAGNSSQEPTSNGNLSHEGKHLPNKKCITSKDIVLLKQTDRSNQVSYYESYDVTNEALKLEDSGEATRVIHEEESHIRKFKGETETALDELDTDIDGEEGGVGEKTKGKISISSSLPPSTSQNEKTIIGGGFSSNCLIRASFELTKWIILFSFVLTECIFWYIYLATV